MTQVYTPRADSVADRAMAHLRLHGITATRPLAEAIEAEPDYIAPSLSTAVKFGAIRRRTIDGVVMWSLGDGTSPAPGEAAAEVATPLAVEQTAPGDVTLTIVNQTSADIGGVAEQIGAPTDRRLIIQEALKEAGDQFSDPNSQMSRSLSRAFKVERRRDGAPPAAQPKPMPAELHINGTPSPIAAPLSPLVETESSVAAPQAPVPETEPPIVETRRVTDAPGPLRIALWSDGTLQLQRGGTDIVVLVEAETRQLMDYLDKVFA